MRKARSACADRDLSRFVPKAARLHIEVVAAAAATAAGRGLLRLVGDKRLRRQNQAGDGSRVLQGGARDLDRVDDVGSQRLPLGPGAEVRNASFRATAMV